MAAFFWFPGTHPQRARSVAGVGLTFLQGVLLTALLGVLQLLLVGLRGF